MRDLCFCASAEQSGGVSGVVVQGTVVPRLQDLPDVVVASEYKFQWFPL